MPLPEFEGGRAKKVQFLAGARGGDIRRRQASREFAFVTLAIDRFSLSRCRRLRAKGAMRNSGTASEVWISGD